MVIADRGHLIHCRNIHSPKITAHLWRAPCMDVCLNVGSQLYLNSGFSFLIYLFIIEINLKVLYRGCKNQSRRHTIQKSCY